VGPEHPNGRFSVEPEIALVCEHAACRIGRFHDASP
jgi:hypothetical protein